MHDATAPEIQTPARSKSPILPEIALNRTNPNTSPAVQAPNDPTASPVASPPHPPVSSPRPLSLRQLHAISLLLAGGTDSQVAAAVGVRRETVCDWRNHHPAFIARLNRERHQRHAATADRYDRLLNQAMDYINSYTQSANYTLTEKMKLSTSLLRLAGRRALTPTPGPTNPADILQSLLSQGLAPAPDDVDDEGTRGAQG